MTQRALAKALSDRAGNVEDLLLLLGGWQSAGGHQVRHPRAASHRPAHIGSVSFTEHRAAWWRTCRDGRHQFAQLLFGELPERRLGHLVDGLTDVRDRLRDAMTQAEG